MLLTPQVISVAFYSEREKSDKFCSEVLISAWGSFTCRKSTTWDPQLYFPSQGSHSQDFYTLKKINQPWLGLNPRTSDPVKSTITTGPPGLAIFLNNTCSNNRLACRLSNIYKFLSNAREIFLIIFFILFLPM